MCESFLPLGFTPRTAATCACVCVEVRERECPRTAAVVVVARVGTLAAILVSLALQEERQRRDEDGGADHRD